MPLAAKRVEIKPTRLKPPIHATPKTEEVNRNGLLMEFKY